MTATLAFSTQRYAALRDDVARIGRFEVGTIEAATFPDGERYQRVATPVSGRDVVLIGGTVSDADTLELFDVACSIVSYGARSLALVIPYFGYSTMERAVKPGEVVTAKTRARLLSAIPLAPAGNRVLLVDLHAEGIPHYFEGGVRPVHVYAKPVIVELVRRFGGDDVVLACTDAGRAKWVESLANEMGVPASFVFKRRLDGSHTEVTAMAAAVAWVRAPFAWPLRPKSAPADGAPAERIPAWETSSRLKEEELTRALTLALFDYLRKSRASGFVVSLSGGADSTAVSSLVALMVRRAIQELGVDGFRDKLGHVRTLAQHSDGASASAGAMVGELLTTVYQASANSSAETRAAAATVARALGSRHLELDVEPLVDSYVAMIEKATGRRLGWQEDDLALQNIQARVRAPGVWMLANLRGALLLATSNRSEAALGYATMDGDTCGGLSPIGGIDKAFLRRWLEWLETSGPEGLGPLPALAVVTKQQSTPELRPRDSRQSSEGDLMPFPVLDAIERLAIRDKLVPRDVLTELGVRFPQHPRARLGEWVERFFTLFSRNQWKRERYAPSFHLDDENLDPKTWCRFPILSGGFRRELGELHGASEPQVGDDR